MRLCCFFNYPPHYRRDIFLALDAMYDCQFYFGREVEGMRNSGIEKMDVTLFRRPVRWFANVKRGRWLWRRKLLRLAFGPYDAYLLTADLCLTYLPFIVLAHLMGKRVYAWGHGIKELKGVARGVQRFLYRHYDGLFIYSEGARRRMIELGFNPSRIHVIYNSLVSRVDRAALDSYRSSILTDRFHNDAPVILFTGRLTAVKRLDMLVEAVKTLNDTGVECNLLIVGDGPYRAELERLIADASLEDRTWLYGACYDPGELGRLIANSAVCVSPGNVGLTALHAMQHGVPVVTHDNFETQGPEYEIVTPGLTGEFFKENELPSLVGAIRRVLELQSTPEGYKKLKDNCLNIIDNTYNALNQTQIFKDFIH